MMCSTGYCRVIAHAFTAIALYALVSNMSEPFGYFISYRAIFCSVLSALHTLPGDDTCLRAV